MASNAEFPFHLRYNFELLSLTVVKNLDYFYSCKTKYWYSEKFVVLLKIILNDIQWYENRIRKLSDSVCRFDISDEVLGNGFRSFDLIFERFFLKFYHFSKDLDSAKSSVFFMADSYLKTLQSYVSVLEGLKPGMVYLLKMLDENDSDQPLIIDKHVTIDEISREYGLIDQTGFYGRCQGFYFCGSMRKTLWGVSVIMASFSDLYQKSGGPLCRALFALLNGIKYIIYPELRCQQIVNIAQNFSVEFLKSFWSLSDTHFMKQLPKWICPKLEVLTELWVPDEPISTKTVDGSKVVVIPVPSSHIPPAPIRCLLMSFVHRHGQVNTKSKSSKVYPPSKSLLFHCHGGGFISQRPENHEIYLRHWARDLNIPILSVDYSLAPAAPFPRALEEVLLVYVWALKNCEKLGWTGEHICFAGDSAGGNLLMGVIIKLISLRIRKPNALLCAYSPLILDLVPSPSRLLCWLDPLLPLGFLFSCLDSYVGAMDCDSNEYVETSEVNFRKRKLSSISRFVDSSITFLQESEWIEVEPNEPEAKYSDNSGDEISQLPVSDLKIKNDRQTLTYSDYLCQFIGNYSEQALMEKNKCDVSKDVEQSEHLLYTFPQDFFYDIKQKCSSLLLAAAGKAIDVVQDNRLYKVLMSPFVPIHFLQSKVKTSHLRNLESPVTEKIRKLKVVASNPYISPLFVSDVVLKEMPQMYFVSLNFDPCLDDSITFAKRMASVGKPVVLDVLDGLPHGFLNFLPFSREAHEGSDICVKRIKEALQIQEHTSC